MITKELIKTFEHIYENSPYWRRRQETKAEYILRHVMLVLNIVDKIPTFEEFTNVKPFKTELIDYSRSSEKKRNEKDLQDQKHKKAKTDELFQKAIEQILK